MIVPIHSWAETITNSSTELFLCNTERSEEQIREMLGILSEVVGDTGVGTIRLREGPEALLEEMLAIVDYLGRGRLLPVIRLFVPWGVTLDVPALEEPRYDRWRDESWEDYDARRVERDKGKEETLRSWFGANREVLAQHVGKFVVVVGASDNSIPYEIFDLIERKLNGERFHLG